MGKEMKPLRSEEETKNDDMKAIAISILAAAKISLERGVSRNGFLQLAASAYASANEEFGNREAVTGDPYNIDAVKCKRFRIKGTVEEIV